MNREDSSIIGAEREASPSRYSLWDPDDEFFQKYQQLSSKQKDVLHRQAAGELQPVDEKDTDSTTSTLSMSTTSSSSHELESMKSARLSRSETKRINRHETHPEALSRIETARNQHSGTVGSRLTPRKSTKTKVLPKMGAGKPYPPILPNREEYVVEFDGVDDPRHAQNWPAKKKGYISVILAFDALAATMGSSIFSSATKGVMQDYHIGQEVATLGTSLFVLGYAFGPIIWAPFSELYGRRLPLIVAAFGFSVFAIGTATAKDVQTIMLTRFFGGLFGSCPLAVVAAAFADMYDNRTRGLAIAGFSAMVFMGPLLAPFVSVVPRICAF